MVAKVRFVVGGVFLFLKFEGAERIDPPKFDMNNRVNLPYDPVHIEGRWT